MVPLWWRTILFYILLVTFGVFRTCHPKRHKVQAWGCLPTYPAISNWNQLWIGFQSGQTGLVQKKHDRTHLMYIYIYTHIYIYVIYIKGDAKNQCFLLATKNGDAFFHVHAVARIHPQVPVDMIQCGSLPRTDLGTTTKTTITSTTTEVGKAQIRHSKNGSHPKVQEDQLPWQQKVA